MPFLQGALWEMKSVMEAVGLVLVVFGDDTCSALTGLRLNRHSLILRLISRLMLWVNQSGRSLRPDFPSLNASQAITAQSFKTVKDSAASHRLWVGSCDFRWGWPIVGVYQLYHVHTDTQIGIM